MRLKCLPSIHPSIQRCQPFCRRAVWIQISLMEKVNEVILVSSTAERKVADTKSILLKDKGVIESFSLKTSVHVSQETTTTFDVHLAALLTSVAESSSYVILRDWALTSPQGEAHWVKWVRSWHGFEKPCSVCVMNGHLVSWEAVWAWTDAYSTHCVHFSSLSTQKKHVYSFL